MNALEDLGTLLLENLLVQAGLQALLNIFAQLLEVILESLDYLLINLPLLNLAEAIDDLIDPRLFLFVPAGEDAHLLINDLMPVGQLQYAPLALSQLGHKYLLDLRQLRTDLCLEFSLRLGFALVGVGAVDVGDVLIDLHDPVVGDYIALLLLLVLHQPILQLCDFIHNAVDIVLVFV